MVFRNYITVGGSKRNQHWILQKSVCALFSACDNIGSGLLSSLGKKTNCAKFHNTKDEGAVLAAPTLKNDSYCNTCNNLQQNAKGM